MDSIAGKRSFFILLLIIGAVVFFAFTGRDSRAANSNIVLITTTPLDKMEWEIQMYEEYLQRTDLPEEMKWGFQRKIEILQMEQTREVLAEIRTPIIPPPTELAPIKVEVTRHVGIIDDFPVSPHHNFVLVNGWQAFVNGDHVTLGAGYLIDDPEQGAVVYSAWGGPFTVFRTEKKFGALKVQDGSENVVVLVSNQGKTFYFDLSSLRFVESKDEIVSTATTNGKNQTPTVPAYPFPQP